MKDSRLARESSFFASLIPTFGKAMNSEGLNKNYKHLYSNKNPILNVDKWIRVNYYQSKFGCLKGGEIS